MHKPNRVYYFIALRTFILFMLCLFYVLSTYAQADLGKVTEAVVEDRSTNWFFVFLGKLHPLIVHFPIALILIAGCMELLKIKRFDSNLRPGINFLVYFSAVSAVLSVVFGLILGNTGDYGGERFLWHQWTGIATAVFAVLAAGLLAIVLKRNKPQWIPFYRISLFLTVLLLCIAGHFGGELTHGQDYLIAGTPWETKDSQAGELDAAQSSANFDFASYSNEQDSLSIDQQVELNLSVRAILAHHCFQCHSSDKTEGKLRLDEKDLVFKGGESGVVIQPGNSAQSELVRRITLPAGHKEAMPGKGKPLGEKDIAIIKLWIDRGAPWPDQAKSIFRVAPLAPRKPELPIAESGLDLPIDRFVNAYFKKNNTKFPELVDDRTYLRRVYFDLIGLPPTDLELKAFEADASADKRARVAKELLDKNDAYATHWTTFWNDLLRNDYSGTGYITGGRFNISGWLYQSLKQNKPYRQFAMELLNPTEESKGFIKGIEWRGAVNSSQTTAMQAAQNLSQAMLGVNLKCASCHDSFVSDWKLADAYAFANIFSEKTLEINRCDVPTGKMADTRILWPELGEITKGGTVAGRTKELADILTQPENGRMYRTLVNRIWGQVMGRGIVAPTDEMDRKPWNQDLLDWLAVDFVENSYDIKKLLFQIVTSKTYQIPSITIDDPLHINSEKFVFSGPLKRKLTAEQFADALSRLVFPVYVESDLKYNPWGDVKAYQGSSEFVRAALVQNDPFQTALGRPSRENISSTRDGQATLLQAMELTNGTKLNETLVQGAKKWITTYKQTDPLIQAIYTQSLNRKPTEKEFNVAKKLIGQTVEEGTVQELLWAIVLLPEFQFID